MSPHRFALFFVALTLVPLAAHAQQGPRDRTARSLIQTAMEDYQNLEIDRAMERLQSADRACANNGCSPRVAARVQMAMGIVAVGGQQNTEIGIESMVRALRLFADIEPDAMLVTSEITAAFEQARQRVRGGHASASGTNPTSPTSASGTNSSGGTLLHSPAPEQLANTPLPVYVEPASALDAAHVYVFFRGNGMRAFERREMTRVANGFGTEIPCAAMIAPAMEYYVQAVDGTDRSIASVGSEASPVRVDIVRTRSHPAATLPGRAPPETCAADTEECPPGMSGPQCRSQGTARSLGDPCGSDTECGAEMHCDAGACAAGAASGGGLGPEIVNPSRFSRFSFDLGGGVGLAFLTGRPSYAEQRVLVDGSGNIVGRNCGDYVCYSTIDPGFAPTFYLSALVRFNITRRIGIGVGARFQFGAADWSITGSGSTQSRSNPFANLLLTGRVYYAFTPNGFSTHGFVASALVGGGVGQIEPKPQLPERETRPGAHVLSGYGNAQAGVRLEYGFRNGFHAGGEAVMQFMFPTFLFDMDFTAFVGFHL